ncbi:protein MpGST33 [Marchantia polymorpha subsp. ruderalis]|uniref:Hemerythrin-like domain-containing protein n=4 Tax=Marchantia polymorpha TaxID=3197 RepID=A0AAF6BQU2_MARPO|nr:hypothetical protein MARPO_0016s0155 [Marchantia polymorpha]BBN14376.1 hypothetical protein Mp_6g11150 [Marchantia polymorpha subsp. ruderalis]|eukprot:PTQ45110.1 hypothetical protein MARPO_0016s0155 [Marchantia polymorpha]
MGSCWSRDADAEEHEWKTEIPKASAVAPASDSPSTQSPTKSAPAVVVAMPLPMQKKIQIQEEQEIKEVKSLRLYGDPMCPLTMQILLALRYKDVHYECSWLDKEWTQKQEWAARNGSELKLAVLQHGRDKISGSPDAILQYIESSFPDKPLVPQGEYVAKKVEEWTAYLRDTLGPLVSQLLYDGEPSIQEELAPELDLALAKVNGGLQKFYGDGPCFFGEQFTMADVLLIPTLALLDPLKEFRGIGICSAYISLLAYKRNMHSLPVYAAAKVTPEALNKYVATKLEQRAPPPLLILMLMQHRSILWHFNKLVLLVDELLKGVQSKANYSPAIGIPQLKRLWKGYGRLVEVLQEHAQMEERVIFPAIEHYNPGVTQEANADHGRDLPITNGIREEIKSLVSLDQGTADYSESLVNLATRLRTLQMNTEEHFQEEEKEFLPLLDSAAFGKEQVEPMVTHCLGVMESSHGHLLPFFLSGLNAQDMYQYMMVLHKSLAESKPSLFTRMLHVVRNADDEFQDVRRIVQERFSTFSPFKMTTAGA